MIPSADLILLNAQVYTVDDDNPTAEAVAVQGNKIAFVGTTVDAQRWIGPDTRVIDGQGRTLLPGLIDSHFHLQWGSETLYGAQLFGLKSLTEVAEVLQQWAATHPEAPWIIGESVSYALPSATEPLTRHHLDALIDDERPLVLVAFDQHSMFVNTAALEAAEILHGLSEPMANGEIVMGADGLATGELYEMDAMNYIRRARPELDTAQKIALLHEALALLASYGITSIHNMDGDLEQAQFYAQLAERNELTTRIYLPFWVKPEMSLATMVEAATTMQRYFHDDVAQGDYMIHSGAVKFFMDGVYESYTAVTLDGYPTQPNNYGEPIWDDARFDQFATEADRLGLQIAVHACGDGAVRRVLDGYQAVQTANGPRDSRHRVEHIEVIHPDDVSRFAELGVIASMQPLHAPLDEGDADVWPTRVHQKDWSHAFAWRTLRAAGTHLALGSDWPVVTLDPFLGLHAALNRKPWSPGIDSHNQTLAQTIRGYTKDAAYTEFQEAHKGQIKVGMWADLVLLSHDIFAMPPEEIRTAQAVVTICNGRVVFKRE